MSRVRFITHPDVVIDPAIPVPQWGLSDRGWDRIRTMARMPWVAQLAAVWCSGERKAVEAGSAVAAAACVELRQHAALGEIDRSSTGYMARGHDENTQVFYAHPDRPAMGWERAVDAQSRIALAIDLVCGASPPGELAVVAHGAVGTLLLCALKDIPIARSEDQPSQGHAFAFDRESRALLHGWCRIEDLA